MDKLDWKILEVLDWHGREAASRIARQVRANSEVVTYRIKRLESDGVIRRYFPVLDLHKLGYHTCRLYFDLEEMDQTLEQEFLNFLDREINAGLIFRMDYPYRYGIIVWVKSMYKILPMLMQIKRKLGKQLIRYQHSIFCTYRLYPKDYLFGKRFHERSLLIEPASAVPYDEEDFRILTALANNARQSTVQMARALRIPQTTISSKMRKLEKVGIILGYRAEIDFGKLGYMNYFLELYLEDNTQVEKIEAWANSCRSTVWLQKIIGACDIEIEVEVKDRTEFESLLNELRQRFPSIRKIVFWSQEYKKFTFLPLLHTP